MIESGDWVLVGALVGVAVLVTSLLWIAYGAQRTWELKAEHAEHIRMMNAEITGVRDKLRGQEITARVMGSVPVSRLIANEAGQPGPS